MFPSIAKHRLQFERFPSALFAAILTLSLGCRGSENYKPNQLSSEILGEWSAGSGVTFLFLPDGKCQWEGKRTITSSGDSVFQRQAKEYVMGMSGHYVIEPADQVKIVLDHYNGLAGNGEVQTAWIGKARMLDQNVLKVEWNISGRTSEKVLKRQ